MTDDCIGHETVGAVAIDRGGNIAAATSTGGITAKRPGRVGDSPLVGCGAYADNESVGVSCTGNGEAIAKITLARLASFKVVHCRNGDLRGFLIHSYNFLAISLASLFQRNQDLFRVQIE